MHPDGDLMPHEHAARTAAGPAVAVRRPPTTLLIVLVAFVGAMIYLVATSLVPRSVPTFTPRVPGAGESPAVGDAAGDRGLQRAGNGDRGADHVARIDTITFDARDAERWQYFSLARGALLEVPDTAGWDIAVRRYHVLAAGAAADLGPIDLEHVPAVPDTAFRAPDGRDDAGHPALRRWYRYGMFTHLLESRGHVYAARTRDGALAALQVLSYYCPGPTPGCLTLRYTHPLPVR